jgi:hypothetical protein
VSQRLFRVLIFIIAVPICVQGQQGQKLRDRDPDLAGSKKIVEDLQQSNFHYGSFYLSSRFRVSDVGFSESGYVPTGDQDSGVSLSVEAPQRLYYRPHQKVIFSVEAVPGYTFFGSRTRQFNYTSRGDLHLLFNHLYIDAYLLGLNQLRAHVSDINRLATVKERTAGVAGEMKYSSRTSLLFNGSSGRTSYPSNKYQPAVDFNGDGFPDGIPVNLLDRDTRNGRLSLTHKTFPKTTLFVAAEGSDYRFRRATSKDSTRLWYGGGFNWNSGRTQFRLEGGPVKLDFDDPSVPDYTGFSGQAGLARSSGPWGFELGADRDLGFAITSNHNFFVPTTVHAGITYQATRRLSLRLNGTRERDEFENDVTEVTDRVDTISFYSVGASYGLQRLRFGGDVGWYQRDSTVQAETDDGIRYLVHLSFTP